MGKAIKKTFNVIWILAIAILLSCLAVVYAVRLPIIQNAVVDKVTRYLSNELKTEVSIGYIYLKPFSSLVVEDLLVRDLQKDTLFFVGEANVNFQSIKWAKKEINIKRASINDAVFNLRSPEGETSNLDFLIHYFSSAQPDTTASTPLQLNTQEIKINNLKFTYILKGVKATPNRVNYDDVDVRELSLVAINPRIENGSLVGQVKHLSLKEKSGLHIKKLSTNFVIDSKKMYFDQLHAVLNRSELHGYYGMYYNELHDFSNYNNNVMMRSELKNSKIHLLDVALFGTPRMPLFDVALGVNVKAEGSVNHLKVKRLDVTLGNATYAKGSALLKNTDNPEKFLLNVDLQQFGSHYKDLTKLMPAFLPMPAEYIPSQLEALGFFNFSGKVSGPLEKYRLNGEFKTKKGNFNADFTLLARGYIMDKMGFDAHISSQKLNLFGLLPRSKEKDYATFELGMQGESFTKKGFHVPSFNLKIQSISYYNYQLQNLTINGLYNNKIFNSQIKVAEKNLTADIISAINFQSDIPNFDIDGSIQDCQLKHFGFSQDSIRFSTDITAKISGNDFLSFEGNVRAKNISLARKQEQEKIQTMWIDVQGLKQNRRLRIRSDVMDADIHGDCHILDLERATKKLVGRYLPSYKYASSKTDIIQDFEFYIKIKNFNPITKIFIPKFSVKQGGFFNGTFNSLKDSIAVRGSLKDFSYDKTQFRNLIVDEDISNGSLEFFSSLDSLILPSGMRIRNFVGSSVLKQDTAKFNLKILDQPGRNETDINGLLAFNSSNNEFPINISLLPSRLLIQNEAWKIRPYAKISMGDRRLKVENLGINHLEQSVSVEGEAGDLGDDVIALKLNQVQLSSFSGFLNNLTKVSVQGLVNGRVEILHPFGKPQIASDVTVQKFSINNNILGDLSVSNEHNFDNKLTEFSVTLKENHLKRFFSRGFYDTETEEINALTEFGNLNLSVFDSFLKSYCSGTTGMLRGSLKLSGNIKKTLLNGVLQSKQAQTSINFLKTRYTIDDKLEVRNNTIKLKNIVLTDAQNHQALANGEIDLSELLQPKVSLNIAAENFLVLNTSLKDNSDFYGKVLASGNIAIKSSLTSTDIKLKLTTEAGTVFNLPFTGGSKTVDEDFIQFKRKSVKNASIERAIPANFSLNLSLSVTEAASVNISTNIGNLTANGKGDLNINMLNSGEMLMNGEYAISKGKYEFSAKQPILSNISKKFELQNGSTITWGGQASDAKLNIKTIYPVVTQVAPLYAAAGRTLSESDPKALQQYPVNVVLTLKGGMTKPDIAFDLEFPSDGSIREDLNAYLNENNKFTQAVSLIVKRSFTKGAADFMDSKAVTQLSAELLSNKLNSIIADAMGLSFININSRSTTDIQTSLKLFDNRLMINGGVTDNSLTYKRNIDNSTALASSANPVNYEISASYAIKKDGSLTLNAFNRPSTFNLYNFNGDRYMSGIGIGYSSEFDSITEWFSFKKKANSKKDSLKQILEKSNKSTLLRRDF